MEPLQCDGDENAGDETRDVTRNGRGSLRRRRADSPMVAARSLAIEFRSEHSDPGSQALAVKDAETGTGGEIGA